MQVVKGKPAPDIFLQAAALFAPPPQSPDAVLVFEDAPSGVEVGAASCCHGRTRACGLIGWVPWRARGGANMASLRKLACPSSTYCDLASGLRNEDMFAPRGLRLPMCKAHNRLQRYPVCASLSGRPRCHAARLPCTCPCRPHWPQATSV